MSLLNNTEKVYVFIFLLFMSVASAQDCLPFNLDILSVYSKTSDTIKPVHDDKGFSFINVNSGEGVYSLNFQEAYPFYKDVAIVKFEERYNLINRNGQFLIEKHIPDHVGKPQISKNNPNIVWFGNVYSYQYESFLDSDFIRRIATSTRNLTVYKADNNKFGYSCKDRFSELKSLPKYDSILSLSENFVLAQLNNKFGLEDASSGIIIPYEYDEAMPFNEINEFQNQKFLAFRKRSRWYYFDWSGKLVLISKFKAEKIANGSEDIIGSVNENGKYNILYKDGELKRFGFDKISKDINIGFKGNEVYFINDNKKIIRYSSSIIPDDLSKISLSTNSPYGDWSHLEITEDFTEKKYSSGEIIRKKTDHEVWKIINESFDICDYISLGESGNRTHVDGEDIILRIDYKGLSIPKYSPKIYDSTDKMIKLYKQLERY